MSTIYRVLVLAAMLCATPLQVFADGIVFGPPARAPRRPPPVVPPVAKGMVFGPPARAPRVPPNVVDPAIYAPPARAPRKLGTLPPVKALALLQQAAPVAFTITVNVQSTPAVQPSSTIYSTMKEVLHTVGTHPVWVTAEPRGETTLAIAATFVGAAEGEIAKAYLTSQAGATAWAKAAGLPMCAAIFVEFVQVIGCDVVGSLPRACCRKVSNSLIVSDTPLATRTYVGCFADKLTNRALPLTISDSGMSIDTCQQIAVSAGSKLFGLQWQSECWFGGSDLAFATRFGESPHCDRKCTNGAAGDLCGGYQSISLWELA